MAATNPTRATFQEVQTAHSSLLRLLFLTLVHRFPEPQAALDQLVDQAKAHLDTGQYDPRTIAGAKRYLDHFRGLMRPTPDSVLTRQ